MRGNDLLQATPALGIWREHVRSTRDKVADTGRGPSGNRLDIMSRAIVTIGGMETSHREYVLEHVLGQLQAAKIRVAPLAERYIDITDLPAERRRIFRRQTIHVLRARTC